MFVASDAKLCFDMNIPTIEESQEYICSGFFYSDRISNERSGDRSTELRVLQRVVLTAILN